MPVAPCPKGRFEFLGYKGLRRRASFNTYESLFPCSFAINDAFFSNKVLKLRFASLLLLKTLLLYAIQIAVLQRRCQIPTQVSYFFWTLCPKMLFCLLNSWNGCCRVPSSSIFFVEPPPNPLSLDAIPKSTFEGFLVGKEATCALSGNVG